MYRNIYYDQNNSKIHLWGDGQHNDLGYSVHDFQPYVYIPDGKGVYTTIDGIKCTKTTSWSETSEDLGMVFEGNVKPETRFLIDKYTDSDKISNDTKVLFLDIEIEKGERYSKVNEAFNVINAMTYKVTGQDYYTCLLLGDSTETKNITVDINNKQNAVRLHLFTSEVDLLTHFLMDYQSFGHNIITGWNVEFFDMPYLYHRIKNVMGYNMAKLLSPDAGIVKVRETKFGYKVIMAGVTVLDYLDLYKKFTYTELPNYRLDTVAKHELGRGKVEYEGDLDYLYKTDINKYAFYNIVDVELVIALDEKKKLIKTTLGICHKGHINYDDYKFTSAYLDGAALVYCKRQGVVASANRLKNKGKAQGAFVKQPIPGLYKWIFDLDLTSLYPMTIISLNISPETKFAKVLNWDEEQYTKKTFSGKYEIEYYKGGVFDEFNNIINEKTSKEKKELTLTELSDLLISKNLSIASNGCMYTLDKKGLIPSILDMWFNERDDHKQMRKQYEKQGNNELAEYHDQEQLITKILLNSFYGVLLLPSFRFYDRDNGESVTITGQSVINWAANAADIFYNKELGTNNNYCIYIDTDSIFEPIEPLFVKRYGPMSNFKDDEILEKSRPIINDVQNFINRSYDLYAKRYHNINSHRWDIKQELVAKRAFWVGNVNSETKKFEGVKKRYAQLIVEKEGHKTSYLDVKGLDVVRSNFPEIFRKHMTEILLDILNDHTKEQLTNKVADVKNKIQSIDIYEIMAASSANNVEKYTTNEFGYYQLGTPVHIKAVLNYNSLLDLKKIYTVPKITDGDKILWCYLRKNPYGITELALKGYQDPEFIVDFCNKYIDKEKMFENLLLSKLENFWLSRNWGKVTLNTLSNKFFNFS